MDPPRATVRVPPGVGRYAVNRPDRVEELRAKFAGNPRRYFAPLANEYRRIGALAESIALCESYLPKLPGHMSGHIVFGQALFDAGRRDEARTVFEQALALDPENLIALRYLGDIAWAVGDAATARRWYERVLEADPRNDDIATQLATLVRPSQPMPRRAERPTEPVPTPWTAPASVPPIAVVDGAPAGALTAAPTEAPTEAPAGTSAPWEAPSEDDGWFPLPSGAELPDKDPFEFPDLPGGVLAGSAEAADWLESVHAAAEAPEDPALAPVPFEEGLVAPVWTDSAALIDRTVSEPTARTAASDSRLPSPDEIAAVFGHEPTDAVVPHPAPVEPIEPEPYLAESQAPVPPMMPTPARPAPLVTPAPVAALHDEPALEDITRLFQAEAFAAGVRTPVRVETVEPVVTTPAPMFSGAVAPAPAPPASEAPVFAAPVSVAPVLEVPVSEAPAAFVTETMAELLVAQGLLDRGIAVYEELVRQRPSEAWLAERLATLRQGQQQAAPTNRPAPAPTARQWWSALASRRSGPAAAGATIAPPFAARPAAPLAAPSAQHPVGVSVHPAAPSGLAALFGTTEEPAAPDAFISAFAGDTAVSGTSASASAPGEAARRLTPAAANDLAQFSAWLKDAGT